MRAKTENNREPITCPSTGRLIARIDREKKKIYLWCKSCGWEEFDLEELSQECKKTEHSA